QAQLARLILSVGSTKPAEQPDIVRDRYVDHTPPALLSLSVDSPANGAVLDTTTATISGKTVAGARVSVASTAVELGGATVKATTKADSAGNFSLDVALG